MVMGFLFRLVLNALALWAAASVVPGISLVGVGPTIVAALVLGLVNAVVRPVLVVLTLPLTLLTLGLFLLVLNAGCLWLTSRLVPGFTITGFGPAFLGALVVSAVSWVASGLLANGAGRGRS